MKNEIRYVCGDLFKLAPKKNILIPHVCNNARAWGAGFVLPLAKHYPQSRNFYMQAERLTLGETQFVACVGGVYVANMVAQTLSGERPLRYNSLAKCMDEVAHFMVDYTNISCIHAPAFGSALAGGNWKFIAELIEDCWLCDNINVNIYYLPGTPHP
jgi:hypothetical protein